MQSNQLNLQINFDTNILNELQNQTLPNLQDNCLKANHLSMKCLGENQAIQFCINEQCKQKPCFVCPIKKCLCRKQHKLCQKGDLEETLEAIKQKIYKTDQIKFQIRKIVQNIVDELSKLQDQLQDKVEKTMKYLQLSKVEQNFYIFNTDKSYSYQFTGEDLSRVWNLANFKSQKNKGIYLQTTDKLKSLEVSILEMYQRTSKQIDEAVTKYKQIALKIQQQNFKLIKSQKLQRYKEDLQTIERQWRNTIVNQQKLKSQSQANASRKKMESKFKDSLKKHEEQAKKKILQNQRKFEEQIDKKIKQFKEQNVKKQEQNYNKYLQQAEKRQKINQRKYKQQIESIRLKFKEQEQTNKNMHQKEVKQLKQKISEWQKRINQNIKSVNNRSQKQIIKEQSKLQKKMLLKQNPIDYLQQQLQWNRLTINSYYKIRGTRNGIDYFQLDHDDISLKVDVLAKFNWTTLIKISLSRCQIDDDKWRMFVSNSKAFSNLQQVVIYANQIKTVLQNDLEQFQSLNLIQFGFFGSNPLSASSKEVLRKYNQKYQPSKKAQY